MRKFLLSVVLYSFAVGASWADPSEPPPPPSLPSGADLMPPATDQSTPMAVPGGNPDSTLTAPPAGALKALDQAQPASSGTGKTTSSSDSLDTGVVQPPPVPQVPAESKAPVVPAKPKAVPSPTPAQVAPLKNMTLSTGASHAVADNGTQGGGTLADYFPATEGTKWSYDYLGGGAKTRQVQCSSQKSMPNGTTRVVLEVTEGRLQFRERYSLYENKVEHTATADKLFKNNFTFKLPGAGESTQWSQNSPGGVVKNLKASFGTGNGREKAYPDCLVVVEKSRRGKKVGPIVISYYAKGIGLAAVETYTSDMKLVPEKSYILSGAPAEASQ